MGFFSGMGFFEKIAFAVLSPVILPAAAAIATYEKVTEGKPFFDSDTQNNQDEQETRELVERKAKEKRAEEERQAIISYAASGLLALQKMYLNTDHSVLASFNFIQLQKAIQENQQPFEIFTHLIPNTSENDVASVAHQEKYSLNYEIQDLKKLRQAIVNIKNSVMNV